MTRFLPGLVGNGAGKRLANRTRACSIVLIERALGALGKTVARPFVAKHRDQLSGSPVLQHKFAASIPLDEPVLEIGPFDRPRLSGPMVQYFDVLSQDELKARAAKLPRRNPDGCPFIHHLSRTGDLSVVDEEFSAVFSSHCIEHQPDLIKHLRDVSSLLQPGGRYYLVIPDKRFCFDHFIRESSADDVLAAKGRVRHTEQAIAAHVTERTHNNSVLHWLGLHGRTSNGDLEAHKHTEDLLCRARAGEYVDVHAWQFTPASFRELIQQLYEQGEIDFQPTRVHNSGFGMIEFMAVLTRVR